MNPGQIYRLIAKCDEQERQIVELLPKVTDLMDKCDEQAREIERLGCEVAMLQGRETTVVEMTKDIRNECDSLRAQLAAAHDRVRAAEEKAKRAEWDMDTTRADLFRMQLPDVDALNEAVARYDESKVPREFHPYNAADNVGAASAEKGTQGEERKLNQGVTKGL